jgi:hypothetical protein
LTGPGMPFGIPGALRFGQMDDAPAASRPLASAVPEPLASRRNTVINAAYGGGIMTRPRPSSVAGEGRQSVSAATVKSWAGWLPPRVGLRARVPPVVCFARQTRLGYRGTAELDRVLPAAALRGSGAYGPSVRRDLRPRRPRPDWAGDGVRKFSFVVPLRSRGLRIAAQAGLAIRWPAQELSVNCEDIGRLA